MFTNIHITWYNPLGLKENRLYSKSDRKGNTILAAAME